MVHADSGGRGASPEVSLLERKGIGELEREAEGGHLRRTLGPLGLIALGIGAIIGAGLFSLTGIAAGDNAGPAVVISFAIAAVGCAFAGMCYSELASMIPVAGGAYTYAYATLGELIGWIIGWDLVLEYAVGAGTVSVSWSRYVTAFLRDLGVNFPAQWALSPFETANLADGSTVQGIINLPAFVIIAMMSALLIRGLQGSARFNAIIVVIKVAVVLAVVGAGIFYIKAQNYVPFIPPNTGEFGHYGWSGVLRGAGVIFFAYIGFDAVSTAAQETKNPQRNMPIGILGSLSICTVLYMAFGFVLTGLVNYKDLHNDADPVVTAIDQTPFHFLQIAVTLGVICGFTTVILVLLFGQSRVFFSMSRDGLLPGVFSILHPKWNTPWISNLIFMVATGLLGALVPIEILGHMTSIGTLLAFIIVCAGVIMLRKSHPELKRSYRVPFVPAIPLAGILVCVTMMASLERMTWIRLVAWLAIGLLIFFGYSRAHSKIARQLGASVAGGKAQPKPAQ
jgi:APA family basic amino acid/polyamine antiporter